MKNQKGLVLCFKLFISTYCNPQKKEYNIGQICLYIKEMI